LLLKFVSLINVADSAFSMGFSVWVEMGHSQPRPQIVLDHGARRQDRHLLPLPSLAGHEWSLSIE
jgi:hypothetical protein